MDGVKEAGNMNRIRKYSPHTMGHINYSLHNGLRTADLFTNREGKSAGISNYQHNRNHKQSQTEGEIEPMCCVEVTFFESG